MERQIYQSEALANEKVRLRGDLEILESTEGYSRLTKRQQQIIRTSLGLQARAERDMDSKHKNDPWYFDWPKRLGGRQKKYSDSLEHIRNWYCHAAIASLETGSLAGEYPPEHSTEFFDAAYLEIRCEYELERAINFYGYPSVVHVNTEPDNLNGEDTQYHSFLALGPDGKNNIVVWDKEGFNRPYRVTSLTKVYKEYPNFKYWGVRKLR